MKAGERMKMRKRFVPLLMRFLIGILVLCVLSYGGVIIYLCVEEGNMNRDPQKITEPYDAIIVLGAQVRPDGQLSVQLSWRMDAALSAWKHRQVPIVVCGAQGKDEPMPEAEAMGRYLEERGVPAEMILKDQASVNTRENLRNARILLSEMKTPMRVLIVTSDYHVPRALAMAKDEGLDGIGLGSPCLPDYWLKNHAREGLAWFKYWAEKYFHIQF